MSLPLQVTGSDAAHERRPFPLGRVDVFEVAGRLFGRAVYEPGWRWSQHVGPELGAEWCEVEHIGLVLAGRAAVRMRDGTEVEMGPGDWFSIPAGHDSWVVGDSEYVSLHLLGVESYARRTLVRTDDQRGQRSRISAAGVQPSVWGDGCTGWTLLAQPALHVMEEAMTAGTRELRHLHREMAQLYYVLDGRAVVEVDGRDVAAEAGQAVEIRPAATHQIRNESDSTLRFLVISSGPPRDDRQDVT